MTLLFLLFLPLIFIFLLLSGQVSQDSPPAYTGAPGRLS